MKKSILFWGILILPVLACCQSLRFKAVEFVCTRYQNQPVNPPEIKVCNGFPVTFDMDSSFLRISSPNEQQIALKVISGSYVENDSLIITKFDGADRKGLKCLVTAYLYKTLPRKHAASFTLEYPDKTYMYYVEEG